MKLFSSLLALVLASPALAAGYTPHFNSLSLDQPLAVTSGGLGNSSGDASSLTVLSGAVSRGLAARFGESINAADYGVVCDYNFSTNTGTDNTAALAAAISAAQTNTMFGGKKLTIPSGNCLTGPQTVTGQIHIEGKGQISSVLVLKSGSTTPLLTFSTNLSPNWSTGSDAYTFVRDLTITSVDGYGTFNAANDASGIHVSTVNNSSVWFYFENINIRNMPNHGFVAAATTGFINLLNPTFQWNGGWGLKTNSTNDTVVTGAQFYFNGVGANSSSIPPAGGGWVSAGDGALFIHNINSFYNTGPGMWLYGPTNVTISGHSEYNGNTMQGIFVSSGTSLTQMYWDTIGFGGNSRLAPNTWSDIEWYNGSGKSVMNGINFPSPYQVNSSNSSRYNIQIDTANGATPETSCRDCFFSAGSINTTGVTNAPSKVTSFGAGGGTLSGPVNINTTTQYRGLTLGNGTHNTIIMQGTTADNDSAILVLQLAGDPKVKLSAGNGIPSFVTTNIGFGGEINPSYPVDVQGTINATTVQAESATFQNLVVATATQYGGQDWGNGGVVFATLEGSTPSNDSGVFVLKVGGVVTARLSAGNGIHSFVTTNMGFAGQDVPKQSIDTKGAIAADKWIAPGGYTVGSLPGAATPAGARAHVTDAVDCTTRLGALSGGGSTFCPVIYNGTAWVQD